MILPLQLRVSKKEVLLFCSPSESPRIGGREEGSFVGPVDQPAEGVRTTNFIPSEQHYQLNFSLWYNFKPIHKNMDCENIFTDIHVYKDNSCLFLNDVKI